MCSVSIPCDVRAVGTPPTTKEVALESVVVDIQRSPLWIVALVNVHTVPLRCTKEVRHVEREIKERRAYRGLEMGLGKQLGLAVGESWNQLFSIRPPQRRK